MGPRWVRGAAVVVRFVMVVYVSLMYSPSNSWWFAGAGVDARRCLFVCSEESSHYCRSLPHGGTAAMRITSTQMILWNPLLHTRNSRQVTQFHCVRSHTSLFCALIDESFMFAAQHLGIPTCTYQVSNSYKQLRSHTTPPEPCHRVDRSIAQPIATDPQQ